MTEEQSELLRKARESLSAAKYLYDGSFFDFAASRAYYSMFYVVEAFLEGDGMSFSKHSAVLSSFGKHYAKTGKVPPEYHQYILHAQELRHIGDYGSFQSVKSEDAFSAILHAEFFIKLAEEKIGPIS